MLAIHIVLLYNKNVIIMKGGYDMLNLLEWNRPLKVNGVVYASGAEALKALKKHTGDIKVELNFENVPQVATIADTKTVVDVKHDNADKPVYLIKVRQYMTKSWDFNDTKNNGVPMPMRIMVGTILEETKGMYKMELSGRPMPSKICMKCGKALTHPVSLLYGIGPECGKHYHINPFNTEEELAENIEQVNEAILSVSWTGWVIKSAIESMVKLDY